ncbi:MAG: DNA polymerase III subunit gamma/tau [Acidobacteria bacterium]|nr:DNA polymerase III subunit gamma/tau [Acidobacteriota bacterium]
MAYQVLARKWRPQRFDEVIGQEPVTRTLRNAIASGRIAHAFVFAGPRGSGKTTTARILAKALNCVQGPTAEPCGVCDACVEVAQGRDIDVLEIDAASHTGIDNIREVVIAGLAITPVRDRYKIFIIDEVHQLSAPSFNALLKSIEEPPAHVVFMMATTELQKIPDTILSRSQVFEFRTIAAKAIARQLRTIADSEKLDVSEAALALIARAAEGSMRDAQSALDQVMAFSGQTITVDEVSTVLGLVGRDLLFDLIDAVVSEDGPRAFALADRAVETGHDLKLVCRELSRVVRDMMVVSVDPSRAGDGELADDERARLVELATRFSREDLMRAFDLLTKAEFDIRNAAQPRYHFEMVLLRWMHLRKLLPLTDLLEQLGSGAVKSQVPNPKSQTAPARTSAPPVAPSHSRTVAPQSDLKDAFLNEVRTGKGFFYNTVVAQAQRIDVAADAITFTFLPTHRALRDQFNETRPWLEAAAQRLAGRRITVTAGQAPAAATGVPPGSASPAMPVASQPGAPAGAAQRDLKAEAMSSSAVQAMLDVFPAEIRDVEEM